MACTDGQRCTWKDTGERFVRDGKWFGRKECTNPYCGKRKEFEPKQKG